MWQEEGQSPLLSDFRPVAGGTLTTQETIALTDRGTHGPEQRLNNWRFNLPGDCLTLYILVTLITFAIGSGISLLVRRTLWTNTTSVHTPTTTQNIADVLEFTPAMRGCGFGYFQEYAMRDGRTMSEGSVCEENARTTQREWRKLLATATQILERVPEYKNRFGEGGERVVAHFPPNEFSPESTRILWYDGGSCYLYISAPTLNIALEFEWTDSYAF